MAIVAGRKLRVVINGMDVSRSVRSVDVSAAADSVVTTTLVLLALPDISGEDIRLTLEPGSYVSGTHPSVTFRRAMWLQDPS